MTIDVSRTIVAKSDQLNADDLVSGPITVQITNVSVVDGDQPVSVSITGGHQPWKPCKTMRRVLVHGWGADAAQWIGRWMTLYREPTVRFGSDQVGGIRVSAMSDIPRRIEVSLSATKGKKAKHTIDVLKPPASTMSAEEFQRACAGALQRGWTREQIRDALGGRAADVPPERRRELAVMFEGPAPCVDVPMSDEEKAAALAAEREGEEQA